MHEQEQRRSGPESTSAASASAAAAPGKQTLTEQLGESDTAIHDSVGSGGRNQPRDVGVVQRALKRHGHSPGTVDHVVGPRTVNAIRVFQRAIHGPVDGLVEPGKATAQHLLAAPAHAPTSAPAPHAAQTHADAAPAPHAAAHAETHEPNATAPHDAARPATPGEQAPPAHGHDPFHVAQGQVTFDSEGTEGGRYHTRKAHWPGGVSGVTIGRGYDLGQHAHAKIVADMVAAGLTQSQAEAYAGAAGLKGGAAHAWLNANRGSLVEISPEQQEALFRTTYQEHLESVEAISGRYAKSHGGEAQDIDFTKLNPAIRDLLVDLRYRGDYTPHSRTFVQPPAIANDLPAFAAVISNRTLWHAVPDDRFERRKRYAQQALSGHLPAGGVDAAETAAPAPHPAPAAGEAKDKGGKAPEPAHEATAAAPHVAHAESAAYADIVKNPTGAIPGSSLTWHQAMWLNQWSRLAKPSDLTNGVSMDTVIANITRQAAALQKVIDHLGKSIHVNCWLRPPEYNKLVHGASNSAHLRGTATDFNVIGMTSEQARQAIKGSPGLYPGAGENGVAWVHLDLEHHAWFHP
jgi:peptidoglycan hydrolase-like protein with peptidoglycan-binding domain